MINLMKGDCLVLLKKVEDESIDMVLADPPFGTEFDARRGVRTKRAHISGIEDFNLDDNLAEQASRYFHKYQPDAGVISTINLTAFSPLELDSSNHTEKLIELWRIERTAGEYYGGKNTRAYINEELAKLGIML